jgi:hypothetical protein
MAQGQSYGTETDCESEDDHIPTPENVDICAATRAEV